MIRNYDYFTTVDQKGLKFVNCEDITSLACRLSDLNEMKLKFVSIIQVRHEITDLPVVISVFEREEDE